MVRHLAYPRPCKIGLSGGMAFDKIILTGSGRLLIVVATELILDQIVLKKPAPCDKLLVPETAATADDAAASVSAITGFTGASMADMADVIADGTAAVPAGDRRIR